MNKDTAIKLFEDKQVRTLWDAGHEKWYISIVDVIATLTESADSNAYWRKLKQRLKAEGNETVTNCHGLKMLAQDGKKVVITLNAKSVLTEINEVKKLPAKNSKKK